MKPTKTSSSQRHLTDVAHRLHLGRVMEAAHGAGLLTTDDHSASSRASWTVEQLMEMSAAKSLYN